MGINSYHCVEPPTQGSDAVTKWLKEDTKDILGSVMYVNTDPAKVAEKSWQISMKNVLLQVGQK